MIRVCKHYFTSRNRNSHKPSPITSLMSTINKERTYLIKFSLINNQPPLNNNLTQLKKLGTNLRMYSSWILRNKIITQLWRLRNIKWGNKRKIGGIRRRRNSRRNWRKIWKSLIRKVKTHLKDSENKDRILGNSKVGNGLAKALILLLKIVMFLLIVCWDSLTHLKRKLQKQEKPRESKDFH